MTSFVFNNKYIVTRKFIFAPYLLTMFYVGCSFYLYLCGISRQQYFAWVEKTFKPCESLHMFQYEKTFFPFQIKRVKMLLLSIIIRDSNVSILKSNSVGRYKERFWKAPCVFRQLQSNNEYILRRLLINIRHDLVLRQMATKQTFPKHKL